MKFATAYTPTPKHLAMSTPKGVSLTVPDMTYTIRDILDKYTRGIDLGISHNGSYDDDPDMDHIDPMYTSEDPLTTRLQMQDEYQQLSQELSSLQKSSANPSEEDQRDDK